MSLATLEDVQRVLDSLPPSGTGRIRIGSDGAISDVDATSILDAIEGQIIAILGFSPTINAFTKEIHSKLTGYHIWIHVIDQSQGKGDIPEYVKEWKYWADKMLEMAKDGDLTIDPIEDDDAILLSASVNLIRSVEDEPVDFTENEWEKLQFYPIVRKSERVRSEEHGSGTLYVRGTDYLINYAQAEIKYITTGSISDSDRVYVSYTHIETAPFRKRPERVEYDDRSGIPNWGGLYEGGR